MTPGYFVDFLNMTSMRKILVLCKSNVCRSPLIEAVLRQLLALKGIDGWQVTSAGVQVGVSRLRDGIMQRVAAGYGFYYDGSSRSVSSLCLDDYDLILVMDYAQKMQVCAQFPFVRAQAVQLFDRVCFGRDTPVEDPTCMPEASYRQTFLHVHEGCHRLMAALRSFGTGGTDFDEWLFELDQQ